ncbi:MAG TPA: ribonuclease P protein component [Bacteroidales bacterium]|nr:ribonuclease P protein component [Bacteroidales bacterium]
MSQTVCLKEGQGLPRSHILRGRSAIISLFAEGQTFSQPPVRVIYRWVDAMEDVPVKVLFSVSKRNFKRAVQRNRIKRLMREAWRRHYKLLADYAAQKQKTLHIALIYSRTDEPRYDRLENKIIQLIHRLSSSDEALA